MTERNAPASGGRSTGTVVRCATIPLGRLAAAVALVAPTASVQARAQEADRVGRLSVDDVLAVESVVSGAPSWSPDGSRILVRSSLFGGLVTLSPDGGFPVRVPADLGSAGHFLASQMPGWSPSGTWISYVSDKSGRPEIWLWSVQDGTERQLTDLGARINSMSWAPDESAVAFAGDRYGNYDIWTVAVETGRVRRLTDDKRYEVFPTWAPDSRSVLYVRLDDAWEDHDVLEMDAAGGPARVVATDEDFFDYGAGATFGYPRVSPDGTRILLRSQRSGWINYWLAPRAGGAPRPAAPAEAEQSGAAWSPDGRWIAYTENRNGTHDLRVVASEGGEPRVLLAPDEGVVSNPAWSPDGSMIVVGKEGLTEPMDLYVVALSDGRAKPITTSMPAGNLDRGLIRPEKVSYPSTDGYAIPAYLYRPADGGERAPGLLWIHGGPTSQFHDAYHEGPQFFAQRGYSVLLPNIRGSSGYGRDFADANNGCWGHCDLEDVVAGADWLGSLPGVDPDRIGLTGRSYGGVMGMYAAAFAPDAFRAIAPASGYTDWVHFHRGENELRHVKLLEHELGSFETHEDVWRASSSIHRVQGVSAPIFLIHGEGRYPGSDQSRIFARALENFYKPFRYVTYPDENYYVYGKANRRQMYLDMLEFFEEFLRDPKVDATVGGSR